MDRAMEFLLNPNVSYFLLVLGFTLAILALFAPGTGFVEVAALVILLAAGYGVINLPINIWALAILLVGVFPFLIALRRSRNWLYLLISLVALIVGSVFLYRNPRGGPAVDFLLAVVVSGLAGLLLWFTGRKGVDAIRKKPAHDLAELVGQLADARTDILRAGTVYANGEEWSARSVTFIPAGSQVKVIGRDGLVLLVEPLAPPHPQA
jgi:membrane-bound serine protease (ClpP class)